MKTFLCEENVLRHNKRNCFPSYLDHYLIGIIVAKETVTNLSGSMRAACVLFLMNIILPCKLLNNINPPSLHNRRIHDMLTLVYKSFHSLVPSYINEWLIERNSSYNLHDKHSLSIPRVQSTKYGLHSFRYSAQRYLDLNNHKSKIKSFSFDNKCCSFCN